MALRELMASISFDADTTPLIEINDGMDDLVDNVGDVSTELDMVGDVTNTTTKGMMDRFSDLSSGMKDVGKMMSVGITAPIMGLGTAGFAAANSLDSAYKDIRANTGATGDELEGLEETFRNVFESIPTSADNVVGAMSAINSATGATDEVLEGLTTNILESSRIMGEDGATNATAFATALNQWQIPADEGELALDRLFKASQNYEIGMGELIGTMSAYGPVLQNAGFEMHEAADLFARLEDSGISVSRVMPGLNSAFRNWASEGKDARTEFQNVIEQMQLAETETEALSIAADAFGAEGAQRLTTAIRNDVIPSVDELGVAIEDSGGIIDEVSEETMTFGDRMTLMKNQTLGALEPLGLAIMDVFESFFPYIEQGIEWFTNLTQQFRDMSPEGQRMTLMIGGIAAALGPMLVVLGSIIGSIPKLVSGFKALTGVTKIFNATLWTSPITWIVVGIVALIAVIVLLWKNWDEVSQWLSASWEWLKSTAISIFSAIGNWISSISNAIVDWIVNAWNSALDWTSSILNSIWNTVVDLFSSVVNSVREKMNDARTTITDIWDKVMDFFRGINLFDVGRDIIQGLIDGISNMASGVWKAVTNIGEGIVNTVKGIFRTSSPSRLMMDIGGDIGEGLQIGLDDSAMNVAKSAVDLANSANPGVYTPENDARSGSRGGAVYHFSPQTTIEVNGNMTPEQERETERKWKRKVEEWHDQFHRKIVVREV